MAKKVLIVDDERDMQIYLKAVCRRAGYQVEIADNGEEGLEKARSFQPDLITLDLVMPRRSGILAFKALREDERTEHIPIVVVTGLAKQEVLQQEIVTQTRPPEALVEKPIDRAVFVETLEEILGGSE